MYILTSLVFSILSGERLKYIIISVSKYYISLTSLRIPNSKMLKMKNELCQFITKLTS